MNGIWSQKKSDIPTEQTKLTQNSKTLTKMGERKRGGGLGNEHHGRGLGERKNE